MPTVDDIQTGVTALQVQRLAAPLVMEIIMALWKVFASSADMSELEADGVMIEAIIPSILLSLMRICRRKGIDFDLVLKDARDLDRCVSAAEKKQSN